MNENDKLSLSVSSGAIINVYVMTTLQWNTLKNSGGLTWEYEVRFKDMTYVDYVFNVDLDNDYYVVFYNKGLLSVYIEYDITYIPYNPFIPDPYDPDPNIFDDDLLTLILIGIFGIIVTGIVLAIALPITHHKKKVKLRQVQPSKYCSNCGFENMDIMSDYCSKCGNKIN